MTQQYLVGEISLRLAQLQATAVEPWSANQLGKLRVEAERSPPDALVGVLIRAFEVTDAICWDSLARGDTVAFKCWAATGAELRDFGVCARLIDDAG